MFIKYNSSNYTLDIPGGTLKKFCISTVLVLLLTYFLSLLVPSQDAKLSLALFSLVGMVPIVIYSHLLLKDSLCTKIFLCSYVLKCAIGIFFYLHFIDAGYFEHPKSVAIESVSDFITMFTQIGNYVDTFDFTYNSILENAIMPHPEMYAMMSLLFRGPGDYILTIIPVNLISSGLMAIMMAYITKKRNGNYQVVAFLCAFFPMSLIPSYFFRDLFGLMLVSIALSIFIFSKGYFKILMLIVASYTFGLQRGPYLIIPILAYFTFLFLNSKGRKNNNKVFAMLFGVIILALGSDYLLGAFEEHDRYMTTTKNLMFYVLFPLRFIQGIIGAFPWTQVFNRPENCFQMQDWFLSASMFYLMFKIFPIYLNDIRSRSQFDYLSIVGLLLMLMGITTNPPHISYVAFGVPFMIPMISRIQFSFRNFVSFNIKYFVIMTILSLIWTAAGFGGVAQIFK